MTTQTQSETVRKHTQGIACPNCRALNNVTSMFEQLTERGYYIKTDGSSIGCQICGTPFNFQLELKVEKGSP